MESFLRSRHGNCFLLPCNYSEGLGGESHTEAGLIVQRCREYGANTDALASLSMNLVKTKLGSPPMTVTTPLSRWTATSISKRMPNISTRVA